MLIREVLDKLITAGLEEDYCTLIISEQGEYCTLHREGSGDIDEKNAMWALIEDAEYQVLGSYLAQDWFEVYFTIWTDR